MLQAETEAVKFEDEVDVVGDRSGARLGQTDSTLSLSLCGAGGLTDQV